MAGEILGLHPSPTVVRERTAKFSFMFKSYTDVRDWLENFIPHTWTRKELGLGRISYLLKLLGNPQNKFKSVHIAGTSGKGSTAFYIARLLQYSKLQTPNSKLQKKGNWNLEFGHWKLRPKVGLHISPHLVDIRERMQINGKLIELNKFIKLIEEVRPAVESMKNSKVGFPSYFEILVASTFLYFAQEKVDWAVVEVGLGGRLDATNVLIPAISLITNVGLDHTDVLGKSIEKIAFEKAGIIKPKVPVVTGASGRALEVIRKVAKEKNAPLIKVDTQSAENVLKSDAFHSSNLPIDIFRSVSYDFVSTNKLLAITTVKTLGISLSKGQIAEAFNSTFPGRFEGIENGVILDGAHNPQKIKFLINFLRKFEVRSSKFEIILVIAFKKGKDWKQMIDLLIKNLPVSKVIAAKFYAVTDMGKYAAVDPKEIAKYVRSVYSLQTTVYSNSHEAVFEAINSYQKPVTRNQKLIIVTGSLYLVGEVRAMWQIPQI